MEKFPLYTSGQLENVSSRQKTDAELLRGGAKYEQVVLQSTGELTEPQLVATEHQVELARLEMEQFLRNEVFPRVVVYGGSKPSEQLLEDASKLGKVLGENYQIVAGGGGGIPAAVLSGAAEVTEAHRKPVEVITAWGDERGYLHKDPNVLHDVKADVGEKRSTLLKGEVIVVFPGTIGTVAEMTSGIDQLGMDAFMGETIKPLVFVGDYWREFFEHEISGRMSSSAKEYITFVDSIEELPAVIESLLSENK